MEISGLSVVVLDSAEAVAVRALVELATLARSRPDALVSLAAGNTYRPFLRELEREHVAGRIDLSAMHFTQHDEFFELEPEDPGSLAHELIGCRPIGEAYAERRFHPMPSAGGDAILREHEAHLQSLGGVQLQFLGIGSNGNIACCEPGTPFARGYHQVELAAATTDHIAARFRGRVVPAAAITAGPTSVLRAARVVLLATGADKAPAVRAMMDESVTATCPASLLRRHPDALVLLDAAAAADLEWPHQAVAY